MPIKNYMLARMGRNFNVYPGFQPKTMYYFAHDCNDFGEKSTRPEQASCARYVQRVSLSEWKTRPVSQ